MRSLPNVFGACFMSVLCLLLISCSGSTPQDFTLSATPSTVALTPGAPGVPVRVTAAPMNGFTGPVSVALTGLPAGITAQPATLSLTPGAASSVTLIAAASAAPGMATLTLSGTSGTLTHTSTVTLAVSAPPPDFTLTVAPASQTLVAGTSGSPISVTANPVNGFTGTVNVTLTGLPTGVTASPSALALAAGVPQSITLSAAVSVPAAASAVTFTGTSGALTHTAPFALTVQTAAMTNAPDVTTYHYNVARDGLNSHETILTPANVNSTQFGRVGFQAVDGKVDAEPLFLANVPVGNVLHNVLYVATEHGSLYAFDADSGTQLWKTSVIPAGETTSDNHSCTQITTEIGITSTPVIDRKQGPNGTVFTVGMSKDAAGKYHQRLHALDIATGAEIAGSPTEITATYPGTGDNSLNGNVVFDPSQYAERSALLLLNGNIYTAWTSHCDVGLYTGWVMAFSETTLQQTQLINLTPNGKMGSVWMSGNGLAADSTGNLFLLDANGTFDTTVDANGFPSKSNFGNAMLKLTAAGGKLAVADYFESFNTVAQSAADQDLGSGGELLPPDLTDAAGAVHHLIVGAGKDKNIYLADRDNLGKFNATGNDTNLYQKVTGQLAGLNYSTPAFFNGILYYGSVGDNLKAFPFTNAKMAATPSSRSAAFFAHPGTTPAVSSNGTTNGIVWAVESNLNSAAVLHAYDPADLTHELYNSNQAPNARDAFGNGNKFITPLVVNGKVYIGTQNGVATFGLLPR